MIIVDSVPYYNQPSFTLRNNGHPYLIEFLDDAFAIFQSKLARAIEFRDCVKVEIIFRSIFFPRTHSERSRAVELDHVTKHIHALWVYNAIDIEEYYGMFMQAVGELARASRRAEVHELLSEFTVYVGDYGDAHG